jgi:hypothetical protein
MNGRKKEIKTSTIVKLTLLTLLIWNSRLFSHIYSLLFPAVLTEGFASKLIEVRALYVLTFGIYLFSPAIVILVASILIYKRYRESKLKFKYRNWLFGIMLMNISFYALFIAQIEPDVTMLFKRFLTFIVT